MVHFLNKSLGILIGCLCLVACSSSHKARYSTHYKLKLTPKQTIQVGQKIWDNESSGTVEGLTSWNVGENFASLGVGHFIWYPAIIKGPNFVESFPQLLGFIQKKGYPLPFWLDDKMSCPWKSRKIFYKEFNSRRLLQLRRFLYRTIPYQVEFILQRVEQVLPRMERELSHQRYQHVKYQFYRVASTFNGVYALIDYVNFKGEGLKVSKDYNNTSWGLLQVLENLKGTQSGTQAVEEFAQSAIHVLKERVKNAPRGRNEKKWLPGWINRINTYVQ